MYGFKIENIQDNGKIIRCMEKVKYNGPMEKYMMVNIKMIKNTALVHSYGLMEENILVNGNRGNNMGEVNIIYLTKIKK